MKKLLAALGKGERCVRVAGLPMCGWGAVAARLSEKADILLVVVEGAGQVAPTVATLRELVRDREVLAYWALALR
jgi:hypothetical protein